MKVQKAQKNHRKNPAVESEEEITTFFGHIYNDEREHRPPKHQHDPVTSVTMNEKPKKIGRLQDLGHTYAEESSIYDMLWLFSLRLWRET